MEDLKRRTVRGGFVKLASQAIGFTLRITFLVIAARLLAPADFGLVSMIGAVTGFYDLFRDGGLATASVQQAVVTGEQRSKLFWINILVGVILTLICLLSAPLLVLLYGEPRLFWLTIALSSGFLMNAAGAQHCAILARELRFTTLAVIDAVTVTVMTAIGIAMAATGWGPWSIAVPLLLSHSMNTLSFWLATSWIPGIPSRNVSIASMMRFGRTVTLSNLIGYITQNLDKILIGRFWGADALGFYGRAFQLTSLPASQLLGTAGAVAFPVLSRLQSDSTQFKNYFLKGFGLVITMMAPVTAFSFAFSAEIIRVAFGDRWTAVAPIFRLLSPTILISAILAPLAWLLFALGRQKRGLAVSAAFCPLCLAACLAGLPYGSNGIAFAYSAAFALWLAPQVFWCLKDTMILPSELAIAAWPPLFSSFVAASAAYLAGSHLGDWDLPFWRLLLDGGVMCSVYFVMLLFVMGKRSFYFGLLSHLKTQAIS